MKTRYTLVVLLLALFSAGTISAQDIIYTTQQQQIRAKVLEIGLDAIRYELYDNPTGPIIAIPIEDVWKIHFENGTEWLRKVDPYDMDVIVEARDKNRAIKFEFFSPLFGKLAFGYEQMIKVGMNLEVKAGIIGPSISPDITPDNPSGAMFKGGIKFLFGTQHLTRGLKRSHALYGAYLKPEILFSSFSQDYDVHSSAFVTTTERMNVTSYGINLVFGKQSIFGNTLTVDWYFGAGYGGQSSHLNNLTTLYEDQELYEPNCYSHTYGGPGFPLVFSAGLAIGILVK